VVKGSVELLSVHLDSPSAVSSARPARQPASPWSGRMRPRYREPRHAHRGFVDLPADASRKVPGAATGRCAENCRWDPRRHLIFLTRSFYPIVPGTWHPGWLVRWSSHSSGRNQPFSTCPAAGTANAPT